MAVRKRGSSWQFDRMYKGKRLRQTFDTEAEALSYQAKVEDAIRLGHPVPEAHSGRTSGTKITNLGELLRYVERSHWRGQKSVAHSIRNAQQFLDWYGANQPVASVDTLTLSEWVNHLDEGGNGPSTITNKLAAVSKMLRKAHEIGVIDRVPAIPRPTKRKTRMDYLEFGEEDAILTTLNHWGHDLLYDLIVVLIDTGFRWSEARRLQWRDVRDRHVTLWETKTDQPRTIPLTTRAKAAIERRHRADAASKGPFSGMSYYGVRSTLQKVYHHLGGRYENIQQPFHIYRHSCASRLAIRGVDAKRIMTWMGHATIVTTMRYMHLAPKDLDEVVGLLDQSAPKAQLREVQ